MNSTIAQAPSRLWAMNWGMPVVFLLLLALFLVAALANGLAPMIWIVVPFAVVGFLTAAWYVPEIFLVAAVFVPQWRSGWPFSLFNDSSYLTAIMLAGLTLGLIFLCFRIALSWDTWTFEGVFFQQKTAILVFGIFAAVVAISYLYTSAPSYGGVKLARLLFIGGLFLFSPLFLLRTEPAFKRFTRLFVGCAMVTAVQMIIGLKSRVVSSDADITRIGAGWLMGMALLLILFYPVFNTTNRQKLFYALSLPLLAAGLVASAARGALMSFALILPLALFVGPRQKQKGMTTVILLLGICAFGAFIFLRSSDPEKYGAKISELISMSEGKATSGSAGKRLAFYRQTAQAIPDHPFFGNGVGSWSVFYFGNDARAYPHNLLLEITFEEGLLGLAVFGVFFLAIASATYRTYEVCGSHFAVVGLVILYGLVVSMFSGDLDDNRLLWLWSGAALAICRNAYLARAQFSQYVRMNQAKAYAVAFGRYRRNSALRPKPAPPTSAGISSFV